MCSMPYPITLQGDCLMRAWRWIYKYSDLSAVAESQFSSFWIHRPWPKHCFCCFPLVGRGRKPIFVVFRSSAVAETQNLSVFDFPPRRKRCFSHFLLFSHGGNEIFAVFYSSAAAESQFSAFFRFQPWMTNDFSWKLMIYPRIWTVFFENVQFTIVFEQIFLKIVNLLSYLNRFFWKSSIYYRIWIVFSENHQFTIVSE